MAQYPQGHAKEIRMYCCLLCSQMNGFRLSRNRDDIIMNPANKAWFIIIISSPFRHNRKPLIFQWALTLRNAWTYSPFGIPHIPSPDSTHAFARLVAPPRSPFHEYP